MFGLIKIAETDAVEILQREWIRFNAHSYGLSTPFLHNSIADHVFKLVARALEPGKEGRMIGGEGEEQEDVVQVFTVVVLAGARVLLTVERSKDLGMPTAGARVLLDSCDTGILRGKTSRVHRTGDLIR